jgi:hypothetical protein
LAGREEPINCFTDEDSSGRLGKREPRPKVSESCQRREREREGGLYWAGSRRRNKKRRRRDVRVRTKTLKRRGGAPEMGSGISRGVIKRGQSRRA